jgi:hypothetical protein
MISRKSTPEEARTFWLALPMPNLEDHTARFSHGALDLFLLGPVPLQRDAQQVLFGLYVDLRKT